MKLEELSIWHSEYERQHPRVSGLINIALGLVTGIVLGQVICKLL